MSSRKYYICKPFYERDEKASLTDDDWRSQAEDIMEEYNSLDLEYVNYIHYMNDNYYRYNYYDDYYDYCAQENPSDWDFRNYDEYLEELNSDSIQLYYSKKTNGYFNNTIYLSEIRSFKNCWDRYTKKINDNCISIYVAPFEYFDIKMADTLNNLRSYPEFDSQISNLSKEDWVFLPSNLKDIPNKFIGNKYLISHKNPIVLDLLYQTIQNIFNKVISIYFQPLLSQNMNDVELDLDHHYLYQCTSQKYREETLLMLYKNSAKKDTVKKKI